MVPLKRTKTLIGCLVFFACLANYSNVEAGGIVQQHDFDGTTGGSPAYTSLTYLNGTFYGMTNYGGANDSGVLFSYQPTTDSHKYTVLHEFSDSADPQATLYETHGILYGVTQYDGSGYGTLFSFDPVSNAYTVLHQFNGTDGEDPWGSVIESGGKLYGMTYAGGSNYCGVIYSYDLASSDYVVLHEFAGGADGCAPGQSLIESNGIFYGLTTGGGTYGYGTLFAYNPAQVGSEYQVLHNLNYSDGANPYGALIESNGIFYGLTTGGGTYGYGSLFSYDPTNVGSEYAILYSFDYVAGSYPYGSLIESNGKFYGTTYSGGIHDYGTIFAFDLSPQPPTAHTVLYTGFKTLNGTLTGHYTYFDPEGDPEGTSTFQWYRDGVAVAGATNLTYVVTAADLSATIQFEVTPVSQNAPTIGIPIKSPIGKTIVVNSVLDDGDGTCTAEKCTLRDAVNTSADGDTITFSVTGTITLTNGSFNTLRHSLIISGPGKDLLTIDINNNFEGLLYVTNGVLSISGLTFTRGDYPIEVNDYGFSGLDLDNVRFSNNDYYYSPVYIDQSKGGVTIINSEFLNNAESEEGGGAIYAYDTDLNIANSTFANNKTSYRGGGALYHSGSGDLVITNSTFVNNEDYHEYGSVLNEGSGFATITNSTFYNDDPNIYNGIYLDTDNLVTNTIFQSANESDTCHATSGGHNIEWGASCGFNEEGDQSITTESPLATLYDFDNATGAHPYGSLIAYNGKFYGLTRDGGANDYGVLFSYDPANIGNEYTVLHNFDYTHGASPYDSLIEVNGIFYGLTELGGGNQYGTIFSYDPTDIGNEYTVLHDFDGVNGGYPEDGALTYVDGKFYGLTTYGGANDSGVLFVYDPANVGNEYTNLYEFTDYAYPQATLYAWNGVLYGVSQYDGSGYGTIFTFDPASNTYAVLHEFDGSDGNDPWGSVVMSGGKLYGMTYVGGDYDYGVIYSYDPNNVGNEYSVMHHFDGLNGGITSRSLISYNDTLYGMTLSGGISNVGVIFSYELANNNGYNVLYKFDGNTSAEPYGSLLEYNGAFYGLTAFGGVDNAGVIFKYDPSASYYRPTLADNGGPVKTIALPPNSPAIDAADDAKAPATDARGYARPYGAHADIGAYEYGAGPSVTPPSPIGCTSHCGGSVRSSSSSTASSSTNTDPISSQTPPTPAACKLGELFSTVTGRPCSSIQTSPTTQATPSSTTSALATTATFIKNLKQGMTSPDVKLLQQYLNTHGFPIATKGPGSFVQETTYFGPATVKALKKFQASVGIPATGYFGPLTRAAINTGL